MANIRYAFGAQVVEVTSSTPLAEVNAALTASNTIVFFSGGTYTGDLEFRGTNVTLFGEGERGGQVTITGNVTVFGDGNRLRGVRITGDLTVPGINAGISFSRVAGTFDFSGDGGTLLNNAFCGTVSVTADQATLLGNAGLDPMPAPTGGC
jgi:pectin methylesterase-like acyl-CoA thioesterase